MWATDYRFACLSTAVVGVYTTSPGVLSRCIGITAGSRCDTGANVQARKMSAGAISSAAFVQYLRFMCAAVIPPLVMPFRVISACVMSSALRHRDRGTLLFRGLGDVLSKQETHGEKSLAAQARFLCGGCSPCMWQRAGKGILMIFGDCCTRIRTT